MGKNIALVTGASSGLGKEFARQIDDLPQIDEIWLIARRRDLLLELKEELKKETKIIAVDLLENTAFAEISSLLAEEQAKIKILVNNAGKGRPGPFTDSTPQYDNELIRLNIEALVRLVNLCLPFCQEGSKILQIGSVAAFLPQPGFALYAASKSFVLSFSRALHQELKGRKINVCCVCPNPMRTEFFDFDRESKGMLSWVKSLGMEKPEKVVKKALARAAKNKDVSVSSHLASLIRILAKILPQRLIIKIIAGMDY